MFWKVYAQIYRHSEEYNYGVGHLKGREGNEDILVRSDRALGIVFDHVDKETVKDESKDSTTCLEVEEDDGLGHLKE